VFCTFVCLPFSVGNWKVTRLSEGDLRERERERERDSWEGAGWQDLPIFY
jgi:hypothetical protein